MAWKIEYTEEFGALWESLDEAAQVVLSAHIVLLEEHGPQLPDPFSESLPGLDRRTARELRLEVMGRTMRIRYRADPHSGTIVLMGLAQAAGEGEGSEEFA